MGTTGRWFFLLVIVATAALGTLFTVQNLDRVTDLSLNLWVVAFALKSPHMYVRVSASNLRLVVAFLEKCLSVLVLTSAVRA